MLQELPGGGAVRDVFDRVLASPDFQRPTESLAERIVRLVYDFLRALFGRWMPTLDDSTLRLVSLALVLVAAGVVVVAGLRRTATRDSTGRRPSRGTSSGGPRSAADWMKRARRAQRDGRLREAAAGLYQAVVLHLEARGDVRYGEWKTPGDYAVEVGGTDAATPFESFLALFVEIAFGPRDPSDESVEALFSMAGRLGCPT